MTDRLSIALAQTNPTVGNIDANIDRIRAARAEAAARGADLVVFPELAVSGCPPEDLVLKPFFLDRVDSAVRALASETADGGPALLVGAPWRDRGGLFNAVLLLDKGIVAAARFKTDLSGHGLFDETRLFTAGPPPGPVSVRGVRLGLVIGADIGTPDVVETLAESGAEILVAPGASPFEAGALDERVQRAVHRVIESGLPLLTVNPVGGQDDVVFDGTSFALAADGGLVAQAPSFAEHLLLTRWERDADGLWACHEAEIIAPAEGLEAVYAALVLGVRDHVNKNHAAGVVLALSGGLDSALTAAIAVDALGAERVHGLVMPSPRTARDRLEDVAEVAELLGCRSDSVPIGPVVKAFDATLAPIFAGGGVDGAADTLRSGARGVALRAWAERFGALVLSAADKSDRSIGRAAAGGDYAVLKDVYRTTAHALARWRNAHVPAGGRGPAGRVVPERVLATALTDRTPPRSGAEEGLAYESLDDILRGLIDQDTGLPEPGVGPDVETVQAVWRMLRAAERQRRQVPPGPNLTRRPINRERRYPITSGFTDLA